MLALTEGLRKVKDNKSVTRIKKYHALTEKDKLKQSQGSLSTKANNSIHSVEYFINLRIKY